jgi:hypothetical protein
LPGRRSTSTSTSTSLPRSRTPMSADRSSMSPPTRRPRTPKGGRHRQPGSREERPDDCGAWRRYCPLLPLFVRPGVWSCDRLHVHCMVLDCDAGATASCGDAPRTCRRGGPRRHGDTGPRSTLSLGVNAVPAGVTRSSRTTR